MENNQNETKIADDSNKISEKNKEILLKLLKEKLEIKITKLEKRHKNQTNVMKIATETIQNITDWASITNKLIKEKIRKSKEKEKEKTFLSPTKSNNKIKIIKKESLTSNAKSSFLKTKTPLRSKTSKTILFDAARTDVLRSTKQKISNKININRNK